MEAVAIIHSPFGEKFGTPRQSGLVDVVSEIRLEKKFRNPDSLRGLEGFDYIWLIWGFSLNHDTEGFRATVRPPRLGGNERLGVFATRSPYRPNPLGLSSVKIDHIDLDRCSIFVRGADLVDGTPIYDIKPYIAYADSHPDARCGFVDESQWHPLNVADPEGLSPELIKALEQDPRPHYQSDPDRIYGLLFNGKNIRFRVVGDTVEVIKDL